MDSFEFNKVIAAILIALLTVKGADLISNALIHPEMPKENAFKIEGVATAQMAQGGQPEQKGPAPIEPLLASANVQKGTEIFKKCTSCHTIDSGGPNRIGPNLHNIVGAQKAKHPGYSYSQAMEKKGGAWSYDDLNVYLYSPRNFVPGTKMSFAGIKNDQERADVIAYMRSQTDNPPPIPAAKEAPSPEAKPTAEEKPASGVQPKTQPAPAEQPQQSTPTAPSAKPEAQPTPKAQPPAPVAKPVEGTPQPTAQPSQPAPAAPNTKPEQGKQK